VIDADIIAFQALKKGTPAYSRVVKAFKEFPEILLPDGDINRPYLRKLVFADKSLNRKLKQCTHWTIGMEMVKQVLFHGLWCGSDVVVLDAPLLYESRADLLCKHVIAVCCDEATQISRHALSSQLLHA
jgi:dephospho-CoA kinase